MLKSVDEVRNNRHEYWKISKFLHSLVVLVPYLTVLSVVNVTLVSVIGLWNMRTEHWWNGGGENRSSGRKTGLSASLSTPVPIGVDWDRNRTSWVWYDIFINCNWVDTRWQQYSTHLHTNSTQNDTKQTIHRRTQQSVGVRAVPRLG